MSWLHHKFQKGAFLASWECPICVNIWSQWASVQKRIVIEVFKSIMYCWQWQQETLCCLSSIFNKTDLYVFATQELSAVKPSYSMNVTFVLHWELLQYRPAHNNVHMLASVKRSTGSVRKATNLGNVRWYIVQEWCSSCRSLVSLGM